jgi:propionyl-CoA synthetase
MIPSALVAILAIARIGAIHAVVFGGFAAASLAQRIDASQPKVIVTASCGIEGAKPPTPYKGFIQGAIEQSSHKPARVIVWQRSQLRWDHLKHDHGERDWEAVTKEARQKGQRAECVPVKSSDPLYIIYTSGTTGLPKGVLREAGGHAVNLNFSMPYVFGIRGPGDVLFTASDIGWVVGHSYILYGPLLAGATTVLFEGKPVGTPDASTFWRVVTEHKANAMFTAPTALRAIRRDDPENKFFKQYGEKGGFRQLRALFVAGERSEPSIIQTYQKLLDQYAASGAQVIDNWWTSEAGSPKSGIAILPRTGLHPTDTNPTEVLVMKPGSAGKPMPGWDVRCVDDEGNEVKAGSMGNIVLAAPLGPSGFVTLYNDEPRFYKGYFARFSGKWLDTGDAGMIDDQGYLHVMSRSDDVINVAAHRFSTGAIEQVIATHAEVAECCVVGIPDSMKGQLPFAFITLSTPEHPEAAIPDDKLIKAVQNSVREQIGAVAALGGMIQGKGMIPKTRSGKTMRRVLRELLENGVHGEFDKAVTVPPTVEDASVVDVARGKIREYFEQSKGRHQAIEARSKL